MNTKRIKSYIKAIEEIATREGFQKKYRRGEHSFERRRKLRFEDVVFCTIGNTKTSFEETAELFSKYTATGTFSSAALCKARQKISGEAFREIQEE